MIHSYQHRTRLQKLRGSFNGLTHHGLDGSVVDYHAGNG